ncbi:MAG: LicD family protein [Acidaminococcaceae bacterium]|nr:LicD family protein [Acidaminococcaceae bacterium]
MQEPHIDIDPVILKKAHIVMVEILKEIDKICLRHNLQWWIEDGTALGAVRHKGFIPWDDDCDIGMMRSDYEKFAKYAVQELPEGFLFQNRDVDPKYKRYIPKVRKKGTKLVEFNESVNEPYNQGIFVDIFVWDYFYSFDKPLNKLFTYMPDLRQKRKKYPRGDWHRMLLSILTGIPYALHSLGETIYKLVNRCYRKNKNAPLVSYEIHVSDNHFYSQDIMFPLQREIEFEGNYFPMPAKPHEYLTELYGDYMQLPPLEERHTHARLIEAN